MQKSEAPIARASAEVYIPTWRVDPTPGTQRVRRLNVASQPNPRTLADGDGIPRQSRKPKRTAGTQVEAVFPEVDPHGFGEPARTTRQIEHACCSARALHELDTLNGFDCT